MDLFSFDHDDHPNLRERSFSVDSATGLDHQAEVLANLRLHANKNSKSSNACPIFAPRAVAPSLTPSAHVVGGGSTAVSSGFYNNNHYSSNKHLPAFFHEVDREQSMTPESSFIKARSQANAVASVGIAHESTESSDQESDDSVEYEVKIDQDFDAHAGSSESRGQSPRPGQSASTSPAKDALKPAKIDTSPRTGPRKPKHKMTPDDFKFLKVIGRGA